MAERFGGKRGRRGQVMMNMVVECHLATAWGSAAFMWAGRKLVICRLTCGHEVKRMSNRRFLTGEKLRCRACEAAYAAQVQALPWENHTP